MINLNAAKIGDRFITKEGMVMVLIEYPKDSEGLFWLRSEKYDHIWRDYYVDGTNWKYDSDYFLIEKL